MFFTIHQVRGIPVVHQRPDSIAILDDDEFRLRMPRYFKLLKRETITKFMLAKLIEVEFDKDSDLEELWRIHDEGVKEQRRILNEVSDEDLVSMWKRDKRPEQSLLYLKKVIAKKILEKCVFCEWRCEVNRRAREVGVCRLDEEALIASLFIHVGEEAELVPSYTVFFSGCNFRCVFCQNWDISQERSGRFIAPQIIAEAIDSEWRKFRIRNVNWVGGEPTPNLHYILEVLLHMEENVPVVWNSNFYDSIETMKLLDGIVDVWLPDFKYGNNECALKYSKIPKYFDVITRNFKLIAEKGEEIIIRHLILPNHVECCTIPILKWLKENLDLSHIRLNLMDQYRPEYKAMKYPELSRRINRDEWNIALNLARELGISLTL
ncbi:MAG: radical SAM protein [Candidatus Njordarchaeia archaeon]